MITNIGLVGVANAQQAKSKQAQGLAPRYTPSYDDFSMADPPRQRPPVQPPVRRAAQPSATRSQPGQLRTVYESRPSTRGDYGFLDHDLPRQQAAMRYQPEAYDSKQMQSREPLRYSQRSADDLVFEKSSWEPGDPMIVADGAVFFDAELRERWELWENWIDWNDTTDWRDASGLLQRIRVGMGVHPVEWFTAYAQMQDARTFFDAPQGPIRNRELVSTDSPADLYQGWIEFGGPGLGPWSLRAGRQVLRFGAERLIGENEWLNNTRSFDAVNLRYFEAEGDWTVNIFAAWPVIHNRDEFNSPDPLDTFTGVYATNTVIPHVAWDIYALWRSKGDRDTGTVFRPGDGQKEGNGAPPGDYLTFGMRWAGDRRGLNGWDFDIELVGQAGKIFDPLGAGSAVGGVIVNQGGQDHLAYAAHAEFGYTFDVPEQPRFWVEYDFASGDNDPTDDHNSTFQDLYSSNAGRRLGRLNRFAWSNIHHLGAGITAQPLPQLFVDTSVHGFWLANTNDLYRSAGPGAFEGLLYGNALNQDVDSFFGTEVDVALRYEATRWLTVDVVYSHLFAGDYLSDAAPTLVNGSRRADDADLVYVQLTFGF